MQLKFSGLLWLPFLVYAAIPKNYQKIVVVTRKRQAALERLLQTRSTFSKSVMVSMCVSKLGPIDLVFINAGVKINSAHCREMLLTQKLMPVMREICGEFFIFQQGFLLTEPARQSTF